MQNKSYQPDPADLTTCNKCGKSCMKGNKDLGGDIEYPVGLIDVVYAGGYFSTSIIDNDVYHFSVCEECLADFMKSFKISARKGQMNPKIEEKYYPDSIRDRERAHEMLREIIKKNGKPN